ncbi:MAG: Copper-exporting P-type ATPase A [Chlamydiae bacterium]|nr:Copper-exporting P-type ATPase A [Chlamydiota bacterium]
MKTTEELACTLCQLPVSQRGLIDDELPFCCHGCQAVYRILESQGHLQNYQDQPVFQQAVKSGLISNPQLLEKLRERSKEIDGYETERLHLEIGEMWCPSCAEVIKLVLMHEKGVRNCVVDYTTDLASIEYCPRFLSKQKIFEIIKSLGYSPTELSDRKGKALHSQLLLRFIIATFCSLNIMMFSFPVYATFFESDPTNLSTLFAWFSFSASLPVLFYSAWPIYRRFWHAFILGFIGMEALITISVGSAFILSTYNLFTGDNHIYFDSMSVVITLLLLGKIIESKAKFSAKDSLLHLTRALPRKGRQYHSDGSTSFRPLKEISIGDILVTHAGEKIVLDGTVVKGEGAADESLMTGEVIPVNKKSGDPVIAGSILQSGSVSYRVTVNLEGSTLQHLIAMIEQELGHKAKYTRAADRIVQWFVPCVVLIALITLFTFQEGFVRALSVLLIACPCSLGIAVPLVESRLIHKLASMGAIVRNRGCLSLLGKESCYIFDKTGTVTEGKFTVLSGLQHLTSQDRSVLKSMCQSSAHPISQAIDQSLQDTPIPLNTFQNFHGKGLKATVNQNTYLLGSKKFISAPDASPTAEIITHVYFAKDDQLLSTIALGDHICPEVPKLIESLPRTYLISGDARSTVSSVARACRFSDYRAEYHPLEKGEFVENQRKQGEVVCFIGDGLNDAPAIAGANIGISVASAADMSIQASDILLTTDDLTILQELRKLGCLARRRIMQNLFWAFGYNVVGVGLAVAGMLSPIYAAGAMVLSSLIVILNAQRLRSFNREDREDREDARRFVLK